MRTIFPTALHPRSRVLAAAIVIAAVLLVAQQAAAAWRSTPAPARIPVARIAVAIDTTPATAAPSVDAAPAVDAARAAPPSRPTLGGFSPGVPRPARTVPAVIIPTTAVLVGAGDIGSCHSPGDEATAKLVARIPGTVFTAGDNAYPNGTLADFRRCYDRSWGRFKDRTRPTPGNHEYHSGGSGYFAYFGAAAGRSGRGWYAYDLGAWRIYALNSSCQDVGGCSTSSPQGRWLRADLADHPRACVAAIWHHPRFSSGAHGSDPRTRGLWRILQAAHAELILTGHDHDYERFAPQDADGRKTAEGIREFVVGTGGAELRGLGRTQPNSQVRKAMIFGVLKLTLEPNGYTWDFLATPGTSFRDHGTRTCH